MPKISVIVTTYNHEAYIAEALDSILCQKECGDFEIVIGNDGSTDNTAKIILEYAKKYKDIIRVLPREKNLGMLYNLKDCLKNAKGDYIAILEGDDYWCDELKLKKMVSALENDEKAGMVFNNIKLLIEQDGKRTFKTHAKDIKRQIKGKITASDFIRLSNPITNFSSCMYKKEVVKIIPDSFYEDKDNADFLFNTYVLDRLGYAIYIKEVCSIYRINPKGLWSSISKLRKDLKLGEMVSKYNDIFDDKYIKEYWGLVNPKRYKRVFGITIPCGKLGKLFFGLMLGKGNS